MPSLRQRISQAANAFFGRETRNVPLPLEGMFHGWGMPALFKPGESLDAYNDNPWLAGAVDKIAREIARTKFRLQKVNAKGEITFVQTCSRWYILWNGKQQWPGNTKDEADANLERLRNGQPVAG